MRVQSVPGFAHHPPALPAARRRVARAGARRLNWRRILALAFNVIAWLAIVLLVRWLLARRP
jgi:hypothetical protein